MLTGWLIGLFLGLRHALEPDHLAALSTLAADRPSPRRGAFLGAAWGLGHSFSLLLVGGGLLISRRNASNSASARARCGRRFAPPRRPPRR
jgi:high-affinity nickel permease